MPDRQPGRVELRAVRATGDTDSMGLPAREAGPPAGCRMRAIGFTLMSREAGLAVLSGDAEFLGVQVRGGEPCQASRGFRAGGVSALRRGLQAAGIPAGPTRTVQHRARLRRVFAAKDAHEVRFCFGEVAG